jgi:hypothetical protein
MLQRFRQPFNSITIEQFERALILQSQIEGNRRLNFPLPKTLKELEYSVFSQFGDDGIIHYLAGLIPSEYHTFIEFGVEDYQESNTRLLLQRDNWRGLVIDGSHENVQRIASSYYFWKHDLTAISAFVSRENINDLISDTGFHGRIGLLHIDIDGMDYWIWEAIEVVKPIIFIAEYNSLFGSKYAVSVPYCSSFNRSEEHFSNLYFGASLAAFVDLAKVRGYQFLGCNSAGNNAFFLESSIMTELPIQTSESGYVRSKFREARNGDGGLVLKTAHDMVSTISHLPIVEIATGRTIPIQDIIAFGF